MQIGFLVDKVSFGGGERILKMLIDGFDKLGHSIVLYTWNKDWNKVKGLDYKIYILQSPPIGLKGKYKALLELSVNLKKINPDCLIVFSLGLAEVAVWSALLANIPIVLSERVDPHYLPKSKLHRWLRNIIYRNSSGIVFQTEEVKRYYSKTIQKRGIVIQNPIIDDDLPSTRNIILRKKIVAVGRLSEEKNCEMLIQAFSELNLEDYTLSIYGDGPLYNKLYSLIDSLHKHTQIKLEGKVSSVLEYIKDADIFVMCSNHEGMPNALIEGMAMGLACISTDFPSGGARALITNNENGIIIPLNSKEALKDSILRLINDESLKLHIKCNALKIRKTNSKTVILPQWINFILSIIQSRKNEYNSFVWYFPQK